MELSSRPRALAALPQTQKISFLILGRQIQLEYQAWGEKGKEEKKGKKKANSKWEFLPKAVILLVFDK